MFNLFKKASLVPSVEPFPEGFLQRAEEASKYTPDAHRLERKLYHRFFIVDELQSTLKNHKLIAPYSAKIASAISVFNYCMLKKSAGVFTTAIPFEDCFYETKLAPVHGELYAVRTDQIYVLDKYKLNTVEFNRVRVPIFIPCAKYQKQADGTFKHAGVFLDGPYTAWMYMGNLEYWSQVFSSYRVKMKIKDREGNDSVSRIANGAVFSSVKMFKPNKIEYEPYYRFTPLEYDDNRFEPINDPNAYSVRGLRKFRRKN